MSKYEVNALVAEDQDHDTGTQSYGYNDQGRRSKSRWHFGVKCGIAIVSTVLVVNAVIIVLAGVKHSVSGGLSTVYSGDCSKAKTYSLWGHLGINLLGTLLLGASNYCQQCLCAPTRVDVDRAHCNKDWVDIGIPSFRNLWRGRLAPKRVRLWWLLALSSIPIHWIYNSAMFESLAGQMYTVVFVSEEFISGPEYTPFVQPNSNIFLGGTDISATNQSLLEIRSVMNSFERLTPSDCVKAYGVQVPASRRDLIVVTNAPSYPVPFGQYDESGFHYDNPNITNSAISITSSEYGNWIYAANSYDWMCDESCTSVSTSFLSALEENWTFEGSEVQYCLSEVVPEKCEFTVNITILAVVIALGVTKLACMVATIRSLQHSPLITAGDALSSFLDDGDANTAGMCTWNKADFVKGNWNSQPRPWISKRARRYSALSLKRWLFCNSLYAIALGTIIGLLSYAMSEDKISAAVVKSSGFGQVQPDTLLSDIRGLAANVLLANFPQIILSFIYLTYNAAFTAICTANEYSAFSKTRKPLRVSNPRGNQRSSFYLNLPYRYAVPIMVLSVALHWFVSQSLFLVKINIYNPQNTHLPDETLSLVPEASVAACRLRTGYPWVGFQPSQPTHWVTQPTGG